MGHEDVATTLAICTDVPAGYVDRVDDVFVDSTLTGEATGEPGDEDGPSEEEP